MCEGWPDELVNTKTRGDPREMVLLQRCDLSVSRHWPVWGYLLGYNVYKKKDQRGKKGEIEIIMDSSLISRCISKIAKNNHSPLCP